MRLLHRTAMAAVATGLAVALAACGSSSGDGAADADGIVLTVIVPTDSKPPTFPGNISAVRAAAKAINDTGGVNGHQLVIRTCNENNNPNDATKCARQAAKDGTVAVVGSFTSFGKQVTDILVGASIPYTGFSGITPAEFSCKTCYAFDSGSLLVYGGLPSGLLSQGVKSLAPVRLDLAAAAINAKGAGDAARAAGLDVKDDIKVGATSTDLAPGVQSLIQSGAQAGISVMPSEGTLAFIKAADQANAPITFGVVDSQIQAGFGQITPSAGKRVFVAGPYPPVSAAADYPGLSRYTREMDAAVSGGDTDAGIRDSSDLRAWLSVHVVAQVAKGVTGQVTASSLNAAFGTAKNIDLFGLLPAWTPSAKGSVPGFEGVSNAVVFFMRIDNGELVLATPVKGIDLNSHKPLT